MENFAQVIPLGFMFFCILFNYTILRDTKDVLVVTAPGSGAEIIPFLKTWVNLPMAIGFMFLYGQLANMLSTQALFYTVIFPFIAFFGAFAFVIYPLRDVIHPNAFCDYVLSVIGDRFSAPVAILRNWSYCLFYVMAELWGSVVVSVLFWVRRPASLLPRALASCAPLLGSAPVVLLAGCRRCRVLGGAGRLLLGPTWGTNGGKRGRGRRLAALIGSELIAGSLAK